MRKAHISHLVVSACAAQLLAIGACATDNGGNVYGDQYGPPKPGLDAGGNDAAPVLVDGGGGEDAASDSGTDGGPEPPTCAAGTVAVLAGADASLTYAVSEKGAAWKGGAVSGGSALSIPAVVALGTGFLGVSRGSGDTLLATSAQALTFGAAGTVIASGVKDAPALTVIGTNAHAVYAKPGALANDFIHRTFDGAAWSGDDPVKPSGGAQSFGNTPPAIAASGTKLVLAQNGTDQGLYVQSFDGAWTTATPIVGAGTFEAAVPPVLVPASGAFDLALLYADNTVVHNIGVSTHEAGKPLTVWSNASLIALAQTSQAFAAALVKPSVIGVVFRGNDAKLYVTFGTIGASAITWTSPSTVLPGGGTTDGPPAIAKGVCGDDAIVVFSAGGTVKATRLRGAVWTAPEAVAGASGSRVAVATR